LRSPILPTPVIQISRSLDQVPAAFDRQRGGANGI
jgi:hypothetical protein